VEQEEVKGDSGISHVPVCGIGASAGGVKALQTLFKELPDDLGLAYVVILHLSPEHPSLLSEILSDSTNMDVVQVEDSPELKPNCIYVIAPDRELIIEGASLKARPFTSPRVSRAPIDMFFRSIAKAGGDGMALVLTGAGSDGSIGVGAVKEGGGVIFVQDPKDAEFPSMPQSAIATGFADFILPIPAMAKRVAEVARSKGAVRSLDLDGGGNELRRVVNLLHSRTGHDFSSYKSATVRRRVLRRMQVRGVLNLKDYAELIQEEPEEANELFADMLISVTRFFRDPEAFQVLANEAIAPLFDDVPEEGLRAWVPGCATGEEAYSIAMMMQEEMERRNVRVPVQIFATDLDEGALGTARNALYPKAIEADLTEDRLKRFFIKENSHYRIRKEIREMVLFASHSVLREPPFLRLDLISCRNLMIYLERSLQEKLCSIFFYGLRARRFLFLGTAETADVASSLFSTVNREARLYSARSSARITLPDLAGREQFPTPRPGVQRLDDNRQSDAEMPIRAHLGLLEQAGPPSILVGERQEIVHLSQNAGKYIQHSGGQFSQRLTAIVRPELRLDLNLALDRALSQHQPTLTLPTAVQLDGEVRRIAMNILPTAEDADAGQQALILFLDAGLADPETGEGELAETQPDEIKRLHTELKVAKEELARRRHEHELSTQELRAANEELQSINEEYRSTAEELETSKEELQSMNEELQTVNSELKDKLESISSAHSDLRNLNAATEVGTLFLDEKMRIRMFTAPVVDLFNVKENDVGRPLTDFTNQLLYDDLENDVHKVLRDLVHVETEVESVDGRYFMMRVRPYRTMEERIEGVVLTFVDITSRHRTEQELAQSEERYRTLFNSINQGFCIVEVLFDENDRPRDYRFVEANDAFAGQTGISDVIGKTMREIQPEHEEHWFEAYGRVAKEREAEHFEAEAAKLGRHYEVYAFPFGEPDSRCIGVLFHDIAERKEAERERQLLTQELSHRVKNTLAVVQGLASQTSRKIGSVEEFRNSFNGRIQALGRAHDLLLETQWDSAELEPLVRNVLQPYDAREGRSLSISGPTVHLQPKQALGLSLIIHELATNAAKYGSLSGTDGRLDVEWSVKEQDGHDMVRLHWRERGGPAVEPPGDKGFGTKLIERSSRLELHGSSELDYAPKGFKAEITFPLIWERAQSNEST